MASFLLPLIITRFIVVEGRLIAEVVASSHYHTVVRKRVDDHDLVVRNSESGLEQLGHPAYRRRSFREGLGCDDSRVLLDGYFGGLGLPLDGARSFWKRGAVKGVVEFSGGVRRSYAAAHKQVLFGALRRGCEIGNARRAGNKGQEQHGMFRIHDSALEILHVDGLRLARPFFLRPLLLCVRRKITGQSAGGGGIALRNLFVEREKLAFA